MNEITGPITISKEYQNEILMAVGYPLIKIEDIQELGMINDKITPEENFKQLIVWPAMREFFKWFPIKNIQEYMSEESFSFDFPTEETFTVIYATLNTAGVGVRDAANPFVNNSVYRAINTTSSYGGGMWGTKYDYGMREARLYDRMERQSLIDTNKVFRIDVDPVNRVAFGFSNILGKLVIEWGEYSTNFYKIPFQRVSEVIDLAKSNLLQFLGMLRSQQNTGLPTSFNYQSFITEASRLREEVINKWKNFSKLSMMRQ